jgi:tetratricopeptide (TPR) repeat protein
VLLAGCERPGGDSEQPTAVESAAAGETKAVMTLPVTTASDDARRDFLKGLYALDMGRVNDANTLFEKAADKDPGFALGYLMTANSSASTEEFTTNLAKAVELAGDVSEAERHLIMITQKGFENDVEGQLALTEALVQAHPESPRAWLALAGVQGGLNRIADSRASMEKAIELTPEMATAHMALGNSCLFLEPKDFDATERHFQKAIGLAPDEAQPYDLLGDVHRAQGKLEAAYQDYTLAAERDPANGSPLQQRGHVNSFLGKYEEARADYDRAMELENARGTNTAPFFAPFRAYVAIHAGDPDAAIAELTELVSKADAMTVEGRRDIKINALTNNVQISMHYGDFGTAEKMLADLAVLMREQADEVGTDQFRRGQEAGIAYWEGMIAARKGDAATARAKVEAYRKLLAPDANPRKDEAARQILGITEFFQKNYPAAIEHLAAGNPNNIYMKYYRGLALSETGRTQEAEAIFHELADYNFNGVNYAMIRKDVLGRTEG